MPPNTIKAKSCLDAGFVYAPYIPLIFDLQKIKDCMQYRKDHFSIKLFIEKRFKEIMDYKI